MNGSRGLGVVAWAFGVLAWTGVASASGPWDKLLTSNRVDADPQKSYSLSEQNGPWMIMVCSFSGEKARDEAKELALEMRKRYKLPAYVYEKKFDLGKDVQGRGLDEYGNPKKMKYQRGGTEVDEVAVLVGDYPSVDDPEAQEALRKLKYYQPDCLTLKEGKSTYRTLAGLRWIQSAILPEGDENKKKGPLGHAFVTTNPILPSDYYVPKGLDPLVIKANEGVKHSLLDCPGKYTVQVAHFTGRTIIDQKEIAAVQHGKEMDSQLAKAAYGAHKLTEALRMLGYEAYEFHDRYESVVTVGSFDSVGQKRADGVTDLDPRIVATMDRFKAEQKVAGAITAKAIVEIPLDPQPMLIHVPKRTAVATLSQRPMRGLQ
jgi:hypothetical protein